MRQTTNAKLASVLEDFQPGSYLEETQKLPGRPSPNLHLSGLDRSICSEFESMLPIKPHVITMFARGEGHMDGSFCVQMGGAAACGRA